MARRRFLAQLAGLPLLALAAHVDSEAENPPAKTDGRTPAEPRSRGKDVALTPDAEGKKPLKIMMKSAWGSDDPTKAAFAFLHGLALADAGHEVQIFLLGEATGLMRKATANAVVPVGWPPLSETLEKVVTKRIPVFA